LKPERRADYALPSAMGHPYITEEVHLQWLSAAGSYGRLPAPTAQQQTGRSPSRAFRTTARKAQAGPRSAH